MSQLRRFTLYGELRRFAKVEKDTELKHLLQWAAKAVRADRLARGHNAKPPADVRELERIYNLQDPRG